MRAPACSDFSGHDARLVRLYAADRLQSLAEALFGRRTKAGDAFHDVGLDIESLADVFS
jgi:hypothetical protein